MGIGKTSRPDESGEHSNGKQAPMLKTGDIATAVPARVPIAFSIGMAGIFISAIMFGVGFGLSMQRGNERWGEVGFISLVVLFGAIVAATKGWSQTSSGRAERQRVARALETSVDPGIVPAEEDILNAAMLKIGEDKSKNVQMIVDLAFTPSFLGVINRSPVLYSTGSEAVGNYLLFGVILGSIAESGARKRRQQEYDAALKAVENQRKADRGVPLRDIIDRSALSFCIPVGNITSINMLEPGLLEINHGFETLYFAVGDQSINRFTTWLRVARRSCGLPEDDSPAFSRAAIAEWAKVPGAPASDSVRQEFAALEGQPALQMGLAKISNMQECRAIRLWRNRTPAASSVRRCVLDRLIDSNMKTAAFLAFALVIGVVIFIIGMGLDAESSDGINSLGELLVAILAFCGMTIGVLGLPLFILNMLAINKEQGLGDSG